LALDGGETLYAENEYSGAVFWQDYAASTWQREGEETEKDRYVTSKESLRSSVWHLGNS